MTKTKSLRFFTSRVPQIFILTFFLINMWGPAAFAVGNPSQYNIKTLRKLGIYFVDDSGSACTNSGSASSNGGTLDQFLQAIAFHESGGNPTAVNPSGAYGKYQYIPQTWHGEAKAYYPAADQYATANLAPENVQDAVAYLQYIPVYKALNGDIFAMAIEHYLPSYAQTAHQNPNDPSLNYVPPNNGGLSVKGYGNLIVDLINSGKTSGIPLNYNAAPDFQTWLAKVGGAPSPTANTSTANTSTAPSNQTSSGCASPSGSATCTTGTIPQRATQCAQAELALWQSGSMKPGTDFQKYSQGRTEAWCADFVSWVYAQAGGPMKDPAGKGTDVSYVPNIQEQGSPFQFHSIDSGYTPQPGDLAIYNGSHVNMVEKVEGQYLTLIGGDESGSGDGDAFYTSSKVAEDAHLTIQQLKSGAMGAPLTGFVSYNQ